MDRAGTDGSHADAERAGQLSLRACGEGRDLLVPDPDPLDPVLSTDGVRDRVESITHNAPHGADTLFGEG